MTQVTYRRFSIVLISDFLGLLGQGIYQPPTRLVLGNLAAWSHGASVVYPSAVFDPKAVVEALVQEGCTALHGVPTHFLGILDEFDKRKGAGERLDISRLRSALLQHFQYPSVGNRTLQNRNCRWIADTYRYDEESH